MAWPPSGRTCCPPPRDGPSYMLLWVSPCHLLWDSTSMNLAKKFRLSPHVCLNHRDLMFIYSRSGVHICKGFGGFFFIYWSVLLCLLALLDFATLPKFSLVHTVASSFRPSHTWWWWSRSMSSNNGPVISELPASSPDNGEHGIVAAALEPSQQVEVNVESIIGNYKLCAKY